MQQSYEMRAIGSKSVSPQCKVPTDSFEPRRLAGAPVDNLATKKKDIIRVVALARISPDAPRTSVVDESSRVMDSARTDVYFSADVETDGPIPGPFSMLSFALVFAGTYDGVTFKRPKIYEKVFYRELKPISNEYEIEALRVNGLDRDRLKRGGQDPALAITEAADWVRNQAGKARPVLVAYPLSFDWTWLYWYFVRFSKNGSPFDYSRCFDIKTAYAIKAKLPISAAGRGHLPQGLASDRPHTHHAIDDAIEQAEIFANIFEWGGRDAGTRRQEGDN